MKSFVLCEVLNRPPHRILAPYILELVVDARVRRYDSGVYGGLWNADAPVFDILDLRGGSWAAVPAAGGGAGRSAVPREPPP